MLEARKTVRRVLVLVKAFETIDDPLKSTKRTWSEEWRVFETIDLNEMDQMLARGWSSFPLDEPTTAEQP